MPEKETQETPKEPTEVTTEDRLKTIEENYRKLETDWKTTQQANSRLGNENQRLKEQAEDKEDFITMQKAMFQTVADQRNIPVEDVEGVLRNNAPDMAKQFDQMVQKREQDRQAKQIGELQREVTAAGFKEGDPQYYEVFGMAAYGDYDGAFNRLRELSETKEPAKETKVDDSVVEEQARKMLEEQGQLKTELPSPASSPRGDTYSVEELSDMVKTPEGRKKYNELFPSGAVTAALQNERLTK